MTNHTHAHYTSLVDLYNTICHRYPDHMAFSCMGQDLTYKTLFQYSSQFAHMLQHQLGCQPGDRLAIMLPNILPYPIVLFGALQAGMTVVSLNPLERAKTLAHELRDSGSTVVVVLENFAHELAKAHPDTQVAHTIMVRIGDIYPFVRSQAMNFTMRYLKRAIKPYHLPEVRFFLDSLDPQRAPPTLKPVTLDHHTLAFIQYTSGTTAQAKGVMLTHGNLLANIQQAKTSVAEALVEGEGCVITALPLYHIFALTANCLIFFSIGAQNVLIPNPRDMKAFLRQVRAYKPTAITGVNTLFHGMLMQRDFTRISWTALTITLGGGMPVSAPVAAAWQRATGCPITQAYGLTETAPAVTINPLRIPFNGSVGLPVPDTEIVILDPDGKPCKTEQAGEICIRGPQVSPGYWQNAEATAASFRHGWFHSGDIGYIDSKGYITIVDRIKDLIIVSGFNVPAVEVEDCIYALDAVAEVAVVGCHDTHQGESIVAHIALKPGHTLTAQHVIVHCHNQLAGYKVPHYVIFHETLPKNPVGKVLKRLLRQHPQRKRI
jgi:long-chain acyl-CoA synthetase